MTDETTDDEGQQPDPDIMQYLEDRYGVEPEPFEIQGCDPTQYDYYVDLGILEIRIKEGFGEAKGCWAWAIHAGSESPEDGRIARCNNVPDACNAADQAAKELLDETREVLG